MPRECTIASSAASPIFRKQDGVNLAVGVDLDAAPSCRHLVVKERQTEGRCTNIDLNCRLTLAFLSLDL
jgi:hypothetical protein